MPEGGFHRAGHVGGMHILEKYDKCQHALLHSTIPSVLLATREGKKNWFFLKILPFTTEVKGEHIMLSWAITFLVIALIAGVVGLSGVAGTATNIAWVLFVVFLIIFAISFITGRKTNI
jgi:uncharacterized membrane protein YtjA (UPF0391 family)